MAYPQTQCGEGQRKEDGGGGSSMSIGWPPLVTEEKERYVTEQFSQYSTVPLGKLSTTCTCNGT